LSLALAALVVVVRACWVCILVYCFHVYFAFIEALLVHLLAFAPRPFLLHYVLDRQLRPTRGLGLVNQFKFALQLVQVALFEATLLMSKIDVFIDLTHALAWSLSLLLDVWISNTVGRLRLRFEFNVVIIGVE